VGAKVMTHLAIRDRHVLRGGVRPSRGSLAVCYLLNGATANRSPTWSIRSRDITGWRAAGGGACRGRSRHHDQYGWAFFGSIDVLHHLTAIPGRCSPSDSAIGDTWCMQ